MDGNQKGFLVFVIWVFTCVFLPPLISFLRGESLREGKKKGDIKASCSKYNPRPLSRTSNQLGNKSVHPRFLSLPEAQAEKIADKKGLTEYQIKYREYLASEEWGEIRQKVFFRSNGFCEACGVKQATEVHHRTYERVGNESLLDLVATCSDCHHKIHFGKQGSVFSSYDYRMKSEAWKPTREVLFRRANNFCEGCGEQPIEDIYNLNRENSSAGVLYELAALCFFCRDRLIKQDAINLKNPTPSCEKFSFEDYLASSEWRLKTQKVTKRANNICEFCAEKPISEVCHLSYSRIGSEMLFDLAGVCSSCESKLLRL